MYVECSVCNKLHTRLGSNICQECEDYKCVHDLKFEGNINGYRVERCRKCKTAFWTMNQYDPHMRYMENETEI